MKSRGPWKWWPFWLSPQSEPEELRSDYRVIYGNTFMTILWNRKTLISSHHHDVIILQRKCRGHRMAVFAGCLWKGVWEGVFNVYLNIWRQPLQYTGDYICRQKKLVDGHSIVLIVWFPNQSKSLHYLPTHLVFLVI